MSTVASLRGRVTGALRRSGYAASKTTKGRITYGWTDGYKVTTLTEFPPAVEVEHRSRGSRVGASQEQRDAEAVADRAVLASYRNAIIAAGLAVSDVPADPRAPLVVTFHEGAS